MRSPDEHEMNDLLERAIVSLREVQVSDSPPAHIVTSTVEALRSVEEEKSSKLTSPRTHSVGSWRWIMRHPISGVAAAAALVLAIGGVTLWFYGNGATPALADFLTPIAKAKTVKFKMTAEPEKGPKETALVMVNASGRMRTEQESFGAKIVTIMDRDTGTSIALVPSQKLAMITKNVNQPKEKVPNIFLLDLRSQAAEFRDRPEFRREPLPGREIDGHRAVGYCITGRGVVLNVWGNPSTDLPIRMELSSSAFPKMKEVILSDFVFNVDLDESLFSLEPPAGYRTETATMDASLPEEKDLVETFRRCSRMKGGDFPDKLDLGAMMQLSMEHYEKTHPEPAGKLSNEQNQARRQERLDEMRKLTKGLGFVFEQLPPEADAHYAGKGVKLGAAGTPIFWYRPKDAKNYRVIYGDLVVREADLAPSVPDAQPVVSMSGPKK
jgi:outer membrane lipoprotein-sorting protein